MSRLSDPTVCPDCRGQVSPDAVCTACGLALTGPLATRLWRAMLTADDLVEQLRRQPVASAVPQASTPLSVAGPGARRGHLAALPADATVGGPRSRHRPHAPV